MTPTLSDTLGQRIAPHYKLKRHSETRTKMKTLQKLPGREVYFRIIKSGSQRRRRKNTHTHPIHKSGGPKEPSLPLSRRHIGESPGNVFFGFDSATPPIREEKRMSLVREGKTAGSGPRLLRSRPSWERGIGRGLGKMGNEEGKKGSVKLGK